jgi:hypothetical protein
MSSDHNIYKKIIVRSLIAEEPVRPVVETGPDLPEMQQTPKPPMIVLVTQPLPTRPSPKVHINPSYKENKGTGRCHEKINSVQPKSDSQFNTLTAKSSWLVPLPLLV